MFYPDFATSECNRKLLSEFESHEIEMFTSLYDCCNDKFPNSIMTCCDTPGSGGCTLSGIVKWLPDWANGHCYKKDTACIEKWEDHWAHETLEICCGRCKSYFVCNLMFSGLTEVLISHMIFQRLRFIRRM